MSAAEDKFTAIAEEFQKQLGLQIDTNAPVSIAEANALRDRIKSFMTMLSAMQEHISNLDQQSSNLNSRADDADEVTKQFRSLASKVTDMAAVQRDVIARLKVVEEKLGIVSFNEQAAPAIIETKPKVKKK